MTESGKIGVLIVEDDSLVAEMIADVLEQSGYGVLGQAKDGGQALEMTLDLKPDVILLDLQLPVLNGLEVAAEISQKQPTPIVVLTAYDSPEYVDQAAKAGVGAFLLKPPNPRELDRAITVSRARFFDLMELRRLNEQLAVEARERRKRENEYRSIIQTTPDGFWMMDEQGRCTEVNQAFADMLQTSIEELIGSSIQDVEAEESPEETARHIEEVKRVGSARFETRHRRRDGRLIDVEISTNYLADQRKFIVFSRDVTEKKKQQTLIRESEERLRAASEASLDSFLIFQCERNAEGEISDFLFVDVNRRAEQTLHLRREDLIGKRMCEVLPINRTHGFFEKYKSVAQTGIALEEEFFLPQTHVPAAWFYHQVVRLDGDRIAISNRDITARKQLENELRHSENLFRGIYENNPVGITLVDPASQRFLQANRAFLTMLGYSEEELKTLTVFEVTHEHDREREKEEIDRRLRGDVHHYNLEKRFVRKDGGVCWARVNGEVVDDPDGRRFALATIVDLTERKKAEDILAKERQRLALVIDGSNLGTWEWNIQTNQTVFNDAWAEMLGYQIADLTPYDYQTWVSLVHPDDIETALRELRLCVDGTNKDYSCEFRMRSKRGEWVWILDRGRVMTFDEAGKPLAMFGTHTHIDNMKKAEEAVRESEKRHRDYISNTPYGVFVVDENGRYIEVNPSACAMTGYTEQELLTMSIAELQTEDSREAGLAHFRQVRTAGNAVGEMPFRRKDGERRWWLVSAVKLSDSRMLGFCNDITDRKRAEEALVKSENTFRSTFHTSPDSININRLSDGLYLDVNEGFLRIMGYERADVLGRSSIDLDIWADPADRKKLVEGLKKSGFVENMEAKFRRKDGSFRDGLMSARIVELNGKPCILSITRDITARKMEQQALQKAEARYREIFDRSRDGFVMVNANGRIIDANKAFCSMLGYALEELKALKDFYEITPAKWRDWEASEIWNKQLMTNGYSGVYEKEYIRKDGAIIPVELQSYAVFGKDGKPDYLWGVVRDITDRKQAENALLESDRRFMDVLYASSDAILLIDDNKFVDCNDATSRMLGYPARKEFLQTHPSELSPPFQPDGTSSVVKADDMMRIAFEKGFHRFEWIHRRANGEDFPVEVSLTPIVYKGRNLLHCVWRDISAIKEAEIEKANLAVQLQQAMKMEAIGRLAGGVAHDFNNLLTGILGNAELALAELRADDPLAEMLDEMSKAAQSAASLTRQLLAFSRKQLIEPKTVNLNGLIRSLEKMLIRLIGEDIALKTFLAEDLGAVKIDPGQFEQVVVNLAVNARDAMPGGGQLTIETDNVDLDEAYCSLHADAVPGPYVMLSISDSGQGMSHETMSHLFEPFFTTKPKGRGTGLGLATIFGAVKQAGGSIHVYSEEGTGTTFKIYLPRMREKAPLHEEKKPQVKMPGGEETILLVEDELIVLNLAKRILERAGYRVLHAPDGGKALLLAENWKKPIHLLLTDVIMPGMNGRQLAERLLQIHPEMKILYTSGYTENVIAHHGVIEEQLNFIGKPYSTHSLAKKVREILDRT